MAKQQVETVETEATESVSLKSMTIQGVSLNVKVPYAEGHVLNANEASTLNQTYLENIRNNSAGKIKKALKAWLDAPAAEGEDAHTEENFVPADELIADIQSYADTYEFGLKRLSNLEPADPVEKEARKIAKDIVNTALRNAGHKVKDVPEDKYEAMVAQVAARETTVAEAKRRIDIAKTIGNDELDFSGLTAGTEEPVEEAETETSEA